MDFDRPTADEVVAAVAETLDPLIGRRITGFEPGTEHHGLDNIYGVVGLRIRLDDGSALDLTASWCNDGTADLEIDVSLAEARGPDRGAA
jgi:hypothetical protein